MELTGDLAGSVCNKINDFWGFYPLMINGAGADSSNRYYRQGRGFTELERISSELAQAISEIPVMTNLEITQAKIQTLSHGIHPSIEEYHLELEQTIFAIENDQLLLNGGMPKQNLIQKCQEQLDNPAFNLDVIFSVLDLGDIQLFSFPGELGSKLGLELKRCCCKVPIIAGYTNGFHYYFMQEEVYGLSFESIGNPIPKGEPEKIIEKFIQSSKLLSNN